MSSSPFSANEHNVKLRYIETNTEKKKPALLNFIPAISGLVRTLVSRILAGSPNRYVKDHIDWFPQEVEIIAMVINNSVLRGV